MSRERSFFMPPWLQRDIVVQLISRAAPTMVPLVEAMSDDEIEKLADRLGKAFSETNAEAD